MKPERQIEELAKIEFGDRVVDIDGTTVFLNCGVYADTRDRYYLHSENGYYAMRRIIKAMNHKCLNDYVSHLRIVCGENPTVSNEHQATVGQMAEAILKAYGKWEDS